MKDLTRISRRDILKNLGAIGTSTHTGVAAIGVTTASTSCVLPNKTEVDSKENYEREHTESDYYEEDDGSGYTHLTEIQSGLVYRNSEYVNAEDRWFHFFRSMGAGYTQQKKSHEDKSGYNPVGMINYQRLRIVNDNTDVAALYTTGNPKDVGAAPSPNSGDDLDWGPAAWTVTLATLSAESTLAATAIPVAQALGALLDNGESASGDSRNYQWNYEWQNGPCESVHYGKYHFASFSGESHADFHTNNLITYSGHGGIKTRYDVYVDPVGDSSDNNQQQLTTTQEAPQIPEPGNPKYTDSLEQSGVAKKIPADQIQDPDLKELADGEPVYRAVNPYVDIDASSEPVKLSDT